MTILKEIIAQLGFEWDDTELKKANEALDDTTEKAKDTEDQFKSTSDSTNIFGDTLKGLKQNLDDAGVSTGGLSRAMALLTNPIALAIAATLALVAADAAFIAGLVAGIGWVRSFTQAMSDTGVELDRIANKVGTSVQNIEALRLAASDLGLETTTADQALGDFAEHLGEALRDPASQSAQLIKTLGVSLYDSAGNARDTESVFEDVGVAIGGLSSEADQARLANVLFGGSGKELIPIFRNGAKAIDDYRQQISDTEPYLEEYTKLSKEQRIAQGQLNQQWKGVSETLYVALVPAVILVTKKITEFVKWINENPKALDYMQYALVALGGVLASVTVILGGLTAALLLLTPIFLPLIIVIGLVAAAFVGIFLALKDFYDFLEGNDSIIGQWIAKIYSIPKAVQEFLDSIVSTSGPIGFLLSQLDNLHNSFIDLLNSIRRFTGLPEITVRSHLQQQVSQAVKGVVPGQLTHEQIDQVISNQRGTARLATNSILGTSFGAPSQPTTEGSKMLNLANLGATTQNKFPPVVQPPANITRHSNRVLNQTNNYEITGPGDPQLFRQIIEEVQTQTNRDALNSLTPEAGATE